MAAAAAAASSPDASATQVLSLQCATSAKSVAVGAGVETAKNPTEEDARWSNVDAGPFELRPAFVSSRGKRWWGRGAVVAVADDGGGEGGGGRSGGGGGTSSVATAAVVLFRPAVLTSCRWSS